MSGKKKLLMVLLIPVLLGSVAAGISWNLKNYVLVGLQFYPRQAQEMDLREEDISVKRYEKLREKLPDCEILWDVPFQDREIPFDVQEITVQTLSQKDIETLECFDNLETVKAEGCTDYEALLKLVETRPDLRVEYTVELGEETFAGTAKQILLETVTAEDVAKLSYLPQLKKVLCSGGEAEDIALLLEYCQTQGLEFLVSLGGEMIDLDTKEVTAGAITDSQLGLLEFLPENSNIRAFAEDFDIIRTDPEKNCHELWRVFGKRENYDPAELPRNNSLQRGLADYLASHDSVTGSGYGIFAFDGEKVIR